MNTTEVRQKMKASKKANELISSALWVASCGLGNGARYNAARQNLGKLIEAGNDIALIANDIFEFDGKSGEFIPIAEKWQALVKDWKVCER